RIPISPSSRAKTAGTGWAETIYGRWVMATELIWTSASHSDVGHVRNVNEDACLDMPQRGLWAVADGMGGHAAGDVASRLVVDALAALPEPDSLAQFVATARDALQSVNLRL